MMDRMKKARKNYDESGFGAKVENQGERLLNKDGSYSTIKTGLPFFQHFSFYHFLIHMKPLPFYFGVLAVYVVINSIFAALYIWCGLEGLTLNSRGGLFEMFWEAFFFSSQTLTTVGYGRISPQNMPTNIVASIEALVGLLSFALVTGLLYGRFSRPKSKVLYSKNALIAPYQKGKGLMFRLANARDSHMNEMEIKVLLSRVEEVNGQNMRKFYSLKLEIDKINFLPSSWTVVHPIDEDSPLKEIDKERFEKSEVEVMVLLKGYDDTFSQVVNSSTSYKNDEVVWNARYKGIHKKGEDGRMIVNLAGINEYELI